MRQFPLIVICDPSGTKNQEPRTKFGSQESGSCFLVHGSEVPLLRDFLWITFTRANPSHDIYGVNSFTEFKHWGCEGSLIIDARLKQHHAPQLEANVAVAKRVDQIFANEPALKDFLK